MRNYLTVVSVVFSALILSTIPVTVTAAPSIEGTYELVSRDLPDGSKQMPPNIAGLQTYTKDYRNFNVFWKAADGKSVSLSYVAKYRFTPKEYQETPIYWMSNNLGSAGVSYQAPAEKGQAKPVTMKGQRIEFQIPGEPPMVVIEGNDFTATAKDAGGKLLFVDHWKKVH